MSRVLPDLTPLRTSRGFRLLFISRTTTALGAQAAEVTVLVQARQLTGSPLTVGLLGVAELRPSLDASFPGWSPRISSPPPGR
jgi:hypothetical protein